MQITSNKDDHHSPAVVLPHLNFKIVIILLFNVIDCVNKKIKKLKINQ
jgi:hypothetical protein